MQSVFRNSLEISCLVTSNEFQPERYILDQFTSNLSHKENTPEIQERYLLSWALQAISLKFLWDNLIKKFTISVKISWTLDISTACRHINWLMPWKYMRYFGNETCGCKINSRIIEFRTKSAPRGSWCSSLHIRRKCLSATFSGTYMKRPHFTSIVELKSTTLKEIIGQGSRGASAFSGVSV